MARWGGILCAAWCLIALAVIGVRVSTGRAFDTDIQSLLPANALDPVLDAAMSSASTAAASRIFILVTAKDSARAAQAGAALNRALTGTGVYVPDSNEGEALARWLYANRNALVCEASAQAFDGAAAARGSLALLFAPIAPVSADLLRHDPFLRTLALGQCLAPPGKPIGEGSVLLSGRLTRSAFRLDVQDQVLGGYQAWRAAWPDVRAARVGAVFHAAFGASQAKSETTVLGIFSLVLVLLALFVVFRRPLAVLATLAVTAAGAIGSLSAALLVFPSVHVMVFLFGSALIGVTSDYALHYLATGPQSGWAPSTERVRQVFRPLLVCMCTTALGFASLALFDVPLFQQVAVFAVAGVFTAWAFTVTLLPLMDPKPRNSARLSQWWDRLEAPFARLRWTRARAIIVGLLTAAVCAAGLARYRPLDDVRQFQQGSPALKVEESQVRAATNYVPSPSFLLSFAATPDGARAHEEAVLAALPAKLRADVFAASRWDPSQARRAANTAALLQRLYGPYLAERAALLGIDTDPFAVAAEADPPRFVSDLTGNAAGRAYLIAPLGPEAAKARPQGPGALFVDPAARYSQAFAGYRAVVGFAIVLAFAFCALVVLALYRSWRALTILAGPALGVVLAVAVPALFGLPASIFSLAALFVVIGAGIDHSVFQYEAAQTRGARIDLAVFLDAGTTIASMGLLGLSQAYPVQAFGVSVAVGVVAAYGFSAFAAHLGSRRDT